MFFFQSSSGSSSSNSNRYQNFNNFGLPISGFFAEAYDGELEWGIVKGVASFGEQSSSGDWVSFASAMAASVVANILSEPIVFREWPHYRQGKCHCWKSCLN